MHAVHRSALFSNPLWNDDVTDLPDVVHLIRDVWGRQWLTQLNDWSCLVPFEVRPNYARTIYPRLISWDFRTGVLFPHNFTEARSHHATIFSSLFDGDGPDGAIYKTRDPSEQQLCVPTTKFTNLLLPMIRIEREQVSRFLGSMGVSTQRRTSVSLDIDGSTVGWYQ